MVTAANIAEANAITKICRAVNLYIIRILLRRTEMRRHQFTVVQSAFAKRAESAPGSANSPEKFQNVLRVVKRC